MSDEFVHKKEYSNVIDPGRETFSEMVEAYELQRGGDNWDHVAVGDTRTSGRNDDVDVEASGSDTFGSDWESLGYSSFEELKEAVESCAVVMDENSDRIAFEQNQQRTDTLTNRDLLLKEKLGRIEIEEGKAVFEEESATELSAWR